MKPKILFVFHSSDIRSGATRSLMNIVDSLIALDKYEIQAVFPFDKGTATEHLESLGVPVYLYKYGKLNQDLTAPIWKRVLKIPIFLWRHAIVFCQARSASKRFRGEGFDVVYSNTSSIVFGGYLGKMLDCKQIWHIREFRILDHKMTFYRGEKWIKRFIQDRSDAVLAVSQAVADYQSDIIDKRKLYVTYNSYSKEFIDPKISFNVDCPLRLLLAGDIKPGKGQLEAVKAVSLVNKEYPGAVSLYLAGREANPVYADEVKSYAKESGVEDYVKFLGFVEDMKSVRKRMDVGLVPSENEAFGRTAIEGMLSMLAMVGRDSGGTSEQIKHGITGLLYDGSVQDLARQLVYLAENRKSMQEIACAGFEEAVAKYTCGYAARVTDEAIQRVLENSRSANSNG